MRNDDTVGVEGQVGQDHRRAVTHRYGPSPCFSLQQSLLSEDSSLPSKVTSHLTVFFLERRSRSSEKIRAVIHTRDRLRVFAHRTPIEAGRVARAQWRAIR